MKKFFAIVLCFAFMMSLLVVSANAEEGLKIVEVAETDINTIVIRFNKDISEKTDISNCFAWFGCDLGGVDSYGYKRLQMQHGWASGTIVENGTAIQCVFAGDHEEGVPRYFKNQEEGSYYFVIHQNFDGAIKTSGDEVLTYTPAELNGVAGQILGYCSYFPLSEVKWIGEGSSSSEINPNPGTSDSAVFSIVLVAAVVVTGTVAVCKKKNCK